MSMSSRYQRLQRLSAGPFPALTVKYGRRYLRDFPDFWPAWIHVGMTLAALARYEEAEQAFAKALEHCPTASRRFALMHLGHLFLEAGDFDQAAEWYQKAIDANPDHASGHIHLGIVRNRQGRFSEAEDAHGAAIRCTNGCIEEAFLNLGIVLRARDRLAEASDCFREALRIDPKYRAARQALRDVNLCMKADKG